MSGDDLTRREAQAIGCVIGYVLSIVLAVFIVLGTLWVAR